MEDNEGGDGVVGEPIEQLHRNEAISAVADDGFLVEEDDDYEYLYNDVNVGKTDIALPLDKLSLDLIKQVEGPSSPEEKKRTYVVLVSTGSFNPPTYMHLRCFELARDALTSEGFCVIGGYMSPVNDAYKKKSLISAEHRVAMCQLACKSSELVMTDPWEASQDSYQRTLTVLSRIKTAVCGGSLTSTEDLMVMLVCGSDLLESFCTPGVWISEQGHM